MFLTIDLEAVNQRVNDIFDIWILHNLGRHINGLDHQILYFDILGSRSYNSSFTFQSFDFYFGLKLYLAVYLYIRCYRI